MGERACVVGGAAAWPFYLATGAWVGQENRRFGNAERLGFYSGREVHGSLPRIQHVVGSVPLTVEEAATRTLGADPLERRVGEVLAAALHEGMTTAARGGRAAVAPRRPGHAHDRPAAPRGRRRVDDVPARRRRRAPACRDIDGRARGGVR